MNRLTKLSVICAAMWGFLVAAPPSGAQGPMVTATGPEIEAHGGFEFLAQQVPSASSVPMYGVDSGLTVGVSRHLGARLDLGYARANNVFNSGHHSDILSYMAGPVFFPVRKGRVSPYGELLLGGARVTGATPDGQGGFVRGYANQFAWAAGGGLELHTAREFSVRVGADYMRTKYFDPNLALTGQGNLRAVMSFTYYVGGRRG